MAETLITLGIIGVVAAFTIPALNNAIQDKENKTAFKKMYTNISQVVQSLAYENGGSIDGQFGSSRDEFKNFFTPSFKSVKTCNNGDSSCWTCNGAKTDDYFLNGSSVTACGMGWWYSTWPGIVLADGSIINFAYISSICVGVDTGLIAPYQGTICGAAIVDVNGCKPPNTWGRDLFIMNIQKNKAFPQGPSYNNSVHLSCDKNPSHWAAGFQCAEYVIQNKDY